MLRLLRAAICLSIFVVLTPGSLLAQRPTGTISGVITDETRAVLPGVTVIVTHTQTNIGRTVVSDDQGRYRALSLDPGPYDVRAELAGFSTAVRSGIELTIGRDAGVDIILRLGEMTEEVVVTGDAPLVGTSTGTLGGVVSREQISELPLDGRGYQALMGLQPGVMLVAKAKSTITQGMGSKFSVSGARYSFNQFLLDGMELNDTRDSTPASVGGSVMGVEAVREFVVLTNNYSAEHGRSAGAVMSVVTKSGTNRFHGSVYEFHRNSALDARNFFEVGEEPLPFKRNQFGVQMDGPLVRDRTFFMVNYEGLRQRLEGPVSLVTLTAEARQGILPGRPLIAVDQRIKPYLALYPLPTPGGAVFPDGTAEWLSASNLPLDQDYFTVRIDHQLSGSTSLMGRYTVDEGVQRRKGDSLLGVGTQDSSEVRNLAVQAKMIVSPTLLNTLMFGINRPNATNVSELPRDITPVFTVEGQPKFGSITAVGLASLSHGTDDVQRQTVIDFTNSAVYVRGDHSLKFGGTFKRFLINNVSEFRAGGDWEFDSLEDLLRNQPRRLRMPAPGFDPERNIRQKIIGFYVQDDARVRPLLTVNFGLRYEFMTVPYEIDGKQSNLKSLFDSDMHIGRPIFENPSLKNFAPRLGFAWDVFGDRKMALRGGFGIFHGQLLSRVWDRSFRRNPPFFNSAEVNSPGPIPFPESRVLALRGLPLSRLSLQPTEFSPSTPYMMQYNFTLQREILPATGLTVAYVGSRGVHLPRVVRWNIRGPWELRDGKKFFAPGLPRRNPNFGDVRYQSTDANSAYNALQLGLSRRLSAGFQLDANYTFSRAIDDGTENQSQAFAGTEISPQDPDNRADFRGLSDIHVKHSFVLNTVYQLPWGRELTGLAGKLTSGWGLSGILRVASGSPFLVVLGTDRARTGEPTGQRPNLRPGFSSNPILGGVDQYFDINAFELQPVGFLGNLGRNTLLGPGMATADFSLLKNIGVGAAPGDFRIQFRAEFFNVFNRANFDVPQPVSTGAVQVLNAVGEPILSSVRLTSTTTSPRQIQFGVKILF
ncbi:MAG: TonB-dependent receptor [Acidobacteria bacterium]|nr:TonB-dependent receptor [Acidobacteriota bacterium]